MLFYVLNIAHAIMDSLMIPFIHELNVNLFIYVHTNNLCRHLTIDKVKTLNPLNLNIAPIKCVAYREIFT